MVFKPHITALLPLLQGIIYLLYERLQQKIWPNVFGLNCEQELLKAPDGATIGVLWQIDSEGRAKPPNSN